MSSGSGRRLSGVTAIIFTVLAIGCGTAFAAPPQDPPGNSGDAPGHQTQESDQPGPPATPPGQEKKETEPLVAPQAASAPAPAPAPAAASANGNESSANPKPAKSQPVHASGPAESPRYTNGQGKPKRNVPAEAEAAPESSVSAAGNSGRHKVTVCHNGHGITVDAHATAAHVGRHGDPYLPAGTKHRAACGTTTSGPTPPVVLTKDPRDPGKTNDPRDPDAPKNPAADPRMTSSTSQGAPADPASPAGDADDPGASTSTTHEKGGNDSGTLAAIPARAQLPFTGAALMPLILIGFGFIGAGALLLRAGSEATPAAARARTSRRRRAAS